MFQIFSFLTMYLCTAILGYVMFPVGGLIYTLLVLPGRLNYVGTIYRLISEWPLRMSFFFKFLGFIVSASGCLLPLFVLQAWFPATLQLPSVLWGAMFGALSVTLGIMHRAHLMQTTHIDDILKTLSGFAFWKNLYDFDPKRVPRREKMQLARMHFADVMAVDLLRIGACFAVIQFTGSALGLLSASPAGVPTPGNAITNVLALMRVISGASWQLDGPFGLLAVGFYGVSIFFFLTFFVSLASRMIDEPLSPEPESDEFLAEIEAAMEQFVAQAAQQEQVEHEGGANSMEESTDNVPKPTTPDV